MADEARYNLKWGTATNERFRRAERRVRDVNYENDLLQRVLALQYDEAWRNRKPKKRPPKMVSSAVQTYACTVSEASGVWDPERFTGSQWF